MDIPAGLGERGLSIWESLASDDPASNALVLEAARTADRLDELDRIIQGDGVLNLMQFRLLDKEVEESGDLNITVDVKFQNVLAEARQQQLALANVLGRIAPQESTQRPQRGDLPENVTPLEKLFGDLKKA